MQKYDIRIRYPIPSKNKKAKPKDHAMRTFYEDRLSDYIINDDGIFILAPPYATIDEIYGDGGYTNLGITIPNIKRGIWEAHCLTEITSTISQADELIDGIVYRCYDRGMRCIVAEYYPKNIADMKIISINTNNNEWHKLDPISIENGCICLLGVTDSKELSSSEKYPDDHFTGGKLFVSGASLLSQFGDCDVYGYYHTDKDNSVDTIVVEIP